MVHCLHGIMHSHLHWYIPLSYTHRSWALLKIKSTIVEKIKEYLPDEQSLNSAQENGNINSSSLLGAVAAQLLNTSICMLFQIMSLPTSMVCYQTTNLTFS